MSPEPKIEDGAGGKLLRLFVAVRLSPETLAELGRVQTELKQLLPPHATAWVKLANMHLTLRFLGSVAGERVPDLRLFLREHLQGVSALELVCERLGCFPHMRFPRVLWAWVHDQNGELAKLYCAVATAAEPFAEKPAEKDFVGHVTLARPKLLNRRDAEQLARFVENAATRKFGAWRCGEIELIQSRLSPAGSEYSTIDVFPL